MRKLNKLILVGLVAFWASCSNEQSTTGATTEPSTAPVANLTDEQKAILARSLYTLVDPSIADSLKEIFGSNINKIYNDYVHTLPYSIKNTRVYHHPSKDKRKVCDIVNFTMENKVERNGVLRAMSYDDDHECAHGSESYSICTSEEAAKDYFYVHPNETILATKIADVDGDTVVITTMGSRKMSNSFWGYGVSCTEALNQFKHSCDSLNGLFWDFGDGCSHDDLELACTSFIPEGQAWFDVLNTYFDVYKNQCQEDSISYAPFDDENYVPVNPYTYQPYLDSMNRVARAEKDWTETLKNTTFAYRWQFSIIDSSVKITVNGSDTYVRYQEYPELGGYLGLGYNTLPNIQIADAYRKEGVYVLPDSLVTKFFPKLAEFPGRLDEFRQARSSKNSIYYLLVLKDVGTKGHLLNSIRPDGIYVTDIVKSGNSCPEDTTIHYSMILLADSPDWDVLNRPIVKTTYVSDKWNCDKPETLTKIEPYGEWIESRMYKYGDYVKLFGKD